MDKIFRSVFIALLLFPILTLFAEKEILQDDYIEIIADKQDHKFASEIMQRLPELINRFQGEIGVYSEFIAKVYLSHDEEDFQNLVATFGGITEHSNAFYSKTDKIIYIKSFVDIGNKEGFYQILHHEYIHAFIDYHIPDAPLWFHEGTSTYFSQQFNLAMVSHLSMDYMTGSLPMITNMEKKYPKNKNRLTSFYAKSSLAVKYLYDKDALAFRELFTSNFHFSLAFERSFSMSKANFYFDFENYLKKQMLLYSIYTLGLLIGLIFPILFIWGWIRKKLKPKQSLYPDDDNQDIIITL